MDTQHHKPLTPRKSQALSALDNHFDILNQRNLSHQSSLQDENGFSYKSLQPMKSVMTLDDKIQKENRPPVLIQRVQTPPISGYRHAGYSSYNETASTNDSHVQRSAPKLEPSRPRPTTGGKTISASLMDRINQSYGDAGDLQRDDLGNVAHQRSRARPRTEQRMSQEQLKMLSRRIDTTLPNSPHGSPCKPILPSIFSSDSDYTKRKSSPPSPSAASCHLSSFSSSLYQTCIDLWPSEPTLGDFASENIKNLTDLLKVRLSQAKYRILAQLQDEERQESQGMTCKKMYPTISSVLHDDIDYSTWPTFEKHPIELSPKRSRGFSCVSGNASNLFRHREAYLQRQRISQQQKRQQQKHYYRQHLQQMKHQQSHVSTMKNHSSAISLPPPASNNLKKDMKRKRRTKSKIEVKSPRNDGRVQASLVSPVVTEDGTRAYVCTPCSKKYKTRNGLAYHFDRCPQQSKQSPTLMKVNTAPMEDEQLQGKLVSSPTGSKSSGVHCVCDHPTDDEKMMVQCDECQLWLHLDCVGTNDAILDDIYHCPRCIDRLNKRPRMDQQPHDMANLIFQQLNDNALTYPLQPASVDHPSSQISISSSQQQPIWDDFDLAENVASTTTATVTLPATTTMTTTSNTNDNNNLWDMSTSDIPSLLYSDTTAMASTLDDDLPYLMDLPSSELSPNDLPPTDWFQFANFDDDFHCDESQPTQPLV